MEAKDTVMEATKFEELFAGYLYGSEGWRPALDRITEAQAEISFKAGKEEANFEWRNEKVPKIMKQFRQEGRKEVVDWVKLYRGDYPKFWGINKEEWQAYLKSLEEGKE